MARMHGDREPPRDGWLTSWVRAGRSASKTLRRDRRFAPLAILTLAVGVAVVTAMSAFVDAVWWSGRLDGSGGRLVMLRGTNANRGLADDGLSLPDLGDVGKDVRGLAALSVLWTDDATVVAGDVAAHVIAARVSANYFRLLHLRVEEGRDFLDADDRPGAPRVAILGRALRARLLGPTAKIPASILIDGVPTEVVGVLAAGTPDAQIPAPEIFYPLARDAASMPRQGRPFSAVARLAPSATLPDVERELATLSERLARAYPASNAGWAIVAFDLDARRTHGLRAVLLLWWAVAALGVVACGNAVALLFERRSARARALATHQALGATPEDARRIALCEAFCVLLPGAALGLVAGHALVRAGASLIPPLLRSGVVFRVDWRIAALIVLASAAAVAAGTALRTRAPGTLAALVRGEGVAVTAEQSRRSGALLAFQIGVAVLLTATATMAASAVRKLATADPGFRSDALWSLDVTLPDALYRDDPSRRVRFYEEAVTRVRALPGVAAAATLSRNPLGAGMSTQVRTPEQREDAASSNRAVDLQLAVGPIAQALGVPLRAGRDFDPAWRPGMEEEVLVSAAVARDLWPDRPAVGKTLVLPLLRLASPLRVVGVVGDVPPGPPGSGGRTVYVPYRARPMGPMQLFVRLRPSPPAVIAAIRSAVRTLEPALPLGAMTDMRLARDQTFWLPRVTRDVLATLSWAALALAVAGAHALATHLAARRRREFALRRALGASRLRVGLLFVRRTLPPMAVGLAGGLAGLAAMQRVLRSFVGEASGNDAAPLSMAALVVGVAVVAVVAVRAVLAAREPVVASLRDH